MARSKRSFLKFAGSYNTPLLNERDIKEGFRMIRPPLRRAACWLGLSFFMVTLCLAPQDLLRGQEVKQTRRDTPVSTRPPSPEAASPLDEPLRLAHQAREKYRSVQDFTCSFLKRERIGGQLLPMEFIQMKARSRP